MHESRQNVALETLFAIGTGEHIVFIETLEFVLSKFTHRGSRVN